MEIILYCLYAFLAGIIMNFMPCSLIILLLKINRVVDNKDKDKNLFVFFGIFFVYFVISMLVLILKKYSINFGWGMHMQSVWFVFTLSLMMFYVTLVGLDLRAISFSNSYKSKKDYINNIITGIIIGVTSTTCSAPFLAAIIGFTLREDVKYFSTIIIYIMMSLGVSLPFFLVEKSKKVAMIISAFKSKSNILKTVTCVFSFTYMMWLLSIVKELSSTLIYITTSFTIMSILVYLLYRHKKYIFVFSFISIFAISSFLTLDESKEDKSKIWTSYSKEKLNNNYFLYFTADWCQNCKVFEKLYLSKDRIKKCDLKFIKVDLTKYNKEHWKLLATFKRNSLPTYVIKDINKTLVLKEGPPLDADFYFKKYDCLK